MKIDDITYKFHWDKMYRLNVVLLTFCVGMMTLLCLSCIILACVYRVDFMALVGLALLILLSDLLVAVVTYHHGSHAIGYMQCWADQIVIKRWMGPKLVIEKRDVMYIKLVDAQELCEHTQPSSRFLHLYRQPAFGAKELSCNMILLGAPYLESRIYGKITRYCNNVDELCLVALQDGQKLLINYPKELLKECKW